MHRTLLFAFALGLTSALGCGGESDPTTTGGGASGCANGEVELSYFGGTKDGESDCAAGPAECGGALSCDDQACIAAMYGLCESPWFGVGCSESGSRLVISCNE